ncbi:MAG: enoyl-CoA hydratase-related protein [bacterium]|nr:enoyl-CoA hydratase-related protein [bacterium]
MVVDTRVSGELGVILINNPSTYNALSSEVFKGLQDAFEKLQKNDAVKVIIFTAEGLSFCAGADVKVIFDLVTSHAREKVRELISGLHEFFLEIDNSTKPTIAAVNGFCLGGGLELALSCDYILAMPSATFSFPEIKLGIIPGLGGTQRLPRKIGVKDATRLIVSARSITAEKSFEIGLVDRIIESDFIAGVKAFSSEILNGTVKTKERPEPNPSDADLSPSEIIEIAKKNPVVAVEIALSAIRNGVAAHDIVSALKIELDHFLVVLFTPDAKEGISAFVKKRESEFLATCGGSRIIVQESVPQEKKEEMVALTPPWETDECKMFRDMVRDFAQKEISPKVKQMEAEEKIPRELIKQMADLGMLGVSYPEKYGGSGLGKIGACILADELAYVHPSIAVFFGAHVTLFCETVYLFGNEDQRARYLVPALRGELIGALSTTEPGVGSDIGSMKTMAKKVSGGFVVKGAKQFITNAEIADHIIIFAQTDSLGGNKTLIALIVDTKSKGFEITKREDKIGLRASVTNSFSLDDVFVPDANVLGEPGQGFKMVMKVFNHSRITLTAGCIGFMRRAYDEAIKFSKNRTLFGMPMWAHQNTLLELSKIETARFMVESMVYRGAWMVDRGLDVRNEAAAIKYWGPELAFNAVVASLRLHGGAGFMEDSPIAMFYRDICVFPIFEGTSTIQLLTRGKEIIKDEIM